MMGGGWGPAYLFGWDVLQFSHSHTQTEYRLVRVLDSGTGNPHANDLKASGTSNHVESIARSSRTHHLLVLF